MGEMPNSHPEDQFQNQIPDVEQFNPSDPKYQKIEDLPAEQKANFEPSYEEVNGRKVKKGFVRKGITRERETVAQKEKATIDKRSAWKKTLGLGKAPTAEELNLVAHEEAIEDDYHKDQELFRQGEDLKKEVESIVEIKPGGDYLDTINDELERMAGAGNETEKYNKLSEVKGKLEEVFKKRGLSVQTPQERQQRKVEQAEWVKERDLKKVREEIEATVEKTPAEKLEALKEEAESILGKTSGNWLGEVDAGIEVMKINGAGSVSEILQRISQQAKEIIAEEVIRQYSSSEQK